MTPPSKPVRDTFGAIVTRTARQWRRAINRQLQPLGLTEATWLPLLHVARAVSPMRQKDLAASLALDNSSVVRLLDELQSAGLIERREGEDRRAKVIHVTVRGQAVVQQVEVQIRTMRKEILADVTDQDLETAFRVLEHILEVLAARETGGDA